MVQLMEERVQSEATVAEYKQVQTHHSYTQHVVLLSCVLQLAQQMDEGHQKQVEELNQELMEVKVSSKIPPQSKYLQNQNSTTWVYELPIYISVLQAQCSMQQQNSTEVEPQVDHPLSEHQATLSSEEKLRKLELELAQTKLALVESQCRNQELEKKLEGSSSSGGRTNRSSFLGRGKKKS